MNLEGLHQIAYLDQGLGSLEEMLSTLGFGAFVVPVDDGLIGNTVFIIQNLRIV